MRYDAFISYRHVKLDSMVAERVHKKLERYRIPRKYQQASGRKRINRVFRDCEELPLSSDLSESIYEALRESEYLILICSPEAMESKWVNREVSYFADYHGQDKIITLLVKGEPGEVFPQIIRHRTKSIKQDDGETVLHEEEVEPLAADVRGRNDSETLRRLNREILRIIAAILNCAYDDLRQRHREHIIKRAIYGLAVAFIVLVAFLTYELQQKALIDRQYRSILESQARFISIEANQMMDKGDRIGAIKTLLSIADVEDNYQDIVTPDQIYALNRALYSYYHSDSYSSLQPIVMRELNSITTKANGVCADSNLFFCIDSEGEAYVYSTPNGDLLWSAFPGDLCDEVTAADNAFIDGCFLNNNRLLLIAKKHFIIVNTAGGACETIISGEMPFIFQRGCPVATAEDCFAVAHENDSNKVCIYDFSQNDHVKTEVIDIGSMMHDAQTDSRANALSFSPDGHLIAIGTIHPHNDYGEDQTIFVFNRDTGEYRSIDSYNVEEIRFIDEKNIAVVEYKVIDKDYSVNFLHYEFCAYLYNLDDNDATWKIYEMDIDGFFDIKMISILHLPGYELNGGRKNLIAFNIANSLIIVDCDERETIMHNYFTGYITGVKIINNNLIIGLSNGDMYRHWIKSYTLMYRIDSDVSSFCYNSKSNCIVEVLDNSRQISFAGIVEDEEMKPVPIEEVRKTSNSDLHENNGLIAAYDHNQIQVRDSESDQIVFRISANDTRTPLFALINNGRQLLVYRGNQRIEIWDVQKQDKLTDQALNANGDWISNFKTELIVDPMGEYFALATGEGVAQVTEKRGWEFPELSIYYIDPEYHVYPYAFIPYGYVNFEDRIIYCRTLRDNSIYYSSPFYTYPELIAKSEKVVKGLGDTQDG